MATFMIQPVDGSCCENPCTRDGPCDPCVPPEPDPNYLCISDGGWLNGTYDMTGTHDGKDYWEVETGGVFVFWSSGDSAWYLSVTLGDTSSYEDVDDGGLEPWTGSWGIVTVAAGRCP